MSEDTDITKEEALEIIRTVSIVLRKLDQRSANLRRTRMAAMTIAHSAGATHAAVAEASGLTPQRVGQIIGPEQDNE